MASNAVGWCALKKVIDVAFFAERGRMRTGQLEG